MIYKPKVVFFTFFFSCFLFKNMSNIQNRLEAVKQQLSPEQEYQNAVE